MKKVKVKPGYYLKINGKRAHLAGAIVELDEALLAGQEYKVEVLDDLGAAKTTDRAEKSPPKKSEEKSEEKPKKKRGRKPKGF